jgi:alkylation response protein AidB-like acyl-CoA dehydrogenase
MDHNVDHLPVWAHAPVTAHSPELAALLSFIGEGASDRDRERTLPFPVIDAIRSARLGALRVEPEAGGGGATNRELFETVIRLGDADPNVAHILRNHFTFVERFVRGTTAPKHEKWRRAVVDGAIFGLAYGELDQAKVGSKDANTVLTPEGDGYRLSGIKYYSTGTLYSDFVLVRAKLPSDSLASAWRSSMTGTAAGRSSPAPAPPSCGTCGSRPMKSCPTRRGISSPNPIPARYRS